MSKTVHSRNEDGGVRCRELAALPAELSEASHRVRDAVMCGKTALVVVNGRATLRDIDLKSSKSEKRVTCTRCLRILDRVELAGRLEAHFENGGELSESQHRIVRRYSWGITDQEWEQAGREQQDSDERDREIIASGADDSVHVLMARLRLMSQADLAVDLGLSPRASREQIDAAQAAFDGRLPAPVPGLAAMVVELEGLVGADNVRALLDDVAVENSVERGARVTAALEHARRRAAAAQRPVPGRRGPDCDHENAVFDAWSARLGDGLVREEPRDHGGQNG